MWKCEEKEEIDCSGERKKIFGRAMEHVVIYCLFLLSRQKNVSLRYDFGLLFLPRRIKMKGPAFNVSFKQQFAEKFKQLRTTTIT